VANVLYNQTWVTDTTIAKGVTVIYEAVFLLHLIR